MTLDLTRPLIVFDLETTGINVAKDRIVEICMIKVFPDGSETVITKRVNPEMEIPKEASDVHGITNEMVADLPTFKDLSNEIYQIVQDSDLAGYNSNRFDLPLLAEEFLRVGVDFDMKNRKAIDVQTIFFKKEPRNLSAALRYYCNKELVGAHGAEADTRATLDILKAQVDRYDDLGNDTSSLEEYSQQQHKNADFAGMIKFNAQEEEIFFFGKHKGKKVVDVLEREPGYYAWIQNADFPLYTKKVLTAIKLRNFNK